MAAISMPPRAKQYSIEVRMLAPDNLHEAHRSALTKAFETVVTRHANEMIAEARALGLVRVEAVAYGDSFFAGHEALDISVTDINETG